MRISVVATGRLKSGPETTIAKRYIERFNGIGRQLHLGPLDVVELNESRHDHIAGRREDEAVRMIAKAAADAIVVTLDEHGSQLSSVEFADKLAHWRDDGVSNLAFLVGGPDGHGEAARSAARMTLSLGAMTLPHGLARIILLEQFYRAASILSGHPYHRE